MLPGKTTSWSTKTKKILYSRIIIIIVFLINVYFYIQGGYVNAFIIYVYVNIVPKYNTFSYSGANGIDVVVNKKTFFFSFQD